MYFRTEFYAWMSEWGFAIAYTHADLNQVLLFYYISSIVLITKERANKLCKRTYRRMHRSHAQSFLTLARVRFVIVAAFYIVRQSLSLCTNESTWVHNNTVLLHSPTSSPSCIRNSITLQSISDFPNPNTHFSRESVRFFFFCTLKVFDFTSKHWKNTAFQLRALQF